MALKLAGGLFKSGSPRYEGGPLVSTVENSMARLDGGDTTELQNLYNTSHNPSEPHRQQWLDVWTTEAPKHLGTAELQAMYARLGGTGTVPPGKVTGGGFVDSLSTFFGQVTGPTAKKAAQTAGEATATKLQPTLILVAVIVGIAIVGAVVLARRR